MRDTLKILLQIREEGLLADFAIGGAIAALVNKFGLASRWEIYVQRYS